MSVWFESFSVFHYFLKTGALIQSHVIRVKLTIYESMYESNQFVFKQIKQVNDEEQFLLIFYSFYFEIKYKNNKICMHNNIKKDYRSKLLNKGNNWCCDVILTRIHSSSETKGKKVTEDKPLIFPKSLCTRLLKVNCFMEVVKGLKTLRVVANFNKKSTNEHH